MQEHLRPPSRETKLGVKLNIKGNAIRNDAIPEIWNEAENEMTGEVRLQGAWGAVVPHEARIHAWPPEGCKNPSPGGPRRQHPTQEAPGSQCLAWARPRARSKASRSAAWAVPVS